MFVLGNRQPEARIAMIGTRMCLISIDLRSLIMIRRTIVVACCVLLLFSATLESARACHCNKPTQKPAPVVGCPEPAPCCVDATVCVAVDTSQVCYTADGVKAFLAIFQAAATQGVENATIRAMNSTKTVPSCVPEEAKKK
jgi:hypothetical protein